MQHYLRELQRQPYYHGKPVTRPRNLQQKLFFDAAAQFESEQRLMFEKRRAEYELLEKHGGDLTGGDISKRIEIIENTYVQPDGSSFYFQPDGASLYLQP